jgi:hypothetical protein
MALGWSPLGVNSDSIFNMNSSANLEIVLLEPALFRRAKSVLEW